MFRSTIRKVGTGGIGPLSIFSLSRRFGVDTRGFIYGSMMIPHPEKADRGGEDAVYASRQVMAVADGVGGWTNQGINPANYSRKLCKNIESICAQSPSVDYLRNPVDLIHGAWKDNQELGSSTLVVVTMPDDENKIYASYVGDSGYCILRLSGTDYFPVVESRPQQKGFNFPRQLGWGNCGDSPKVAANYCHTVQNGDIVVLGTDGVFDNLSPKQVATVVTLYMNDNNGEFNANRIADAIAQEAFRLSIDEEYNSPFSQEAIKSGHRYAGGKSDDISVTVGKISIPHIGDVDRP